MNLPFCFVNIAGKRIIFVLNIQTRCEMMKDRIKMIMESQQMSQQDFAKKLGISPASLSSIFTGRTNPTNNHVRAIHNAFPAINIEWLMFGDGSMLSPSGGSVQNEAEGEADLPAEIKEAAGSGPEEKHGGGADFIDGDLFSQVASNTSKKPAPEVIKETKIIRRAVKEIRIFYDDGTYESFVPSK